MMRISHCLRALAVGLTIGFLPVAAASGSGSWSPPSVLAPTVGVDPGSAEIHALPPDADDVVSSNKLPLGGSLVTYTGGSHVYALELDSGGNPGIRHDISGASGDISGLKVDFSFFGDRRERSDGSKYTKFQLNAIVFVWVSSAPDGSSRVMSGSLSVDGKVGPVAQRSELAVPPDAVADPVVAAGETLDGEVTDRGFAWRQRNGSDWRIAVRVIDAEGAASPVSFASEPLGEASEPGIASIGAGEYRVAWLQQTPQGKNIITAGFDSKGAIKLYKPVPGASPPNPNDPPRPEYDYTRYQILQPTENFGPGVVGDPSDLRVWSSRAGVVRMAWVRARAEGGTTRRVIEGVGYIDGVRYWVDRRPTETTPPGLPVNNTLALTRFSPMTQAVTDLSIMPSSTAKALVAFRSVDSGKHWIMGGTAQSDGTMSIRARDRHDSADAGGHPRAGVNSRGATVLTWTESSSQPGGTGSWAMYTPSGGRPSCPCRST